MHCLELDAAVFMPGVICNPIYNKRIYREKMIANMTVKDIYNFDPDNYYIDEDEFLNILSQTFGL